MSKLEPNVENLESNVDKSESNIEDLASPREESISNTEKLESGVEDAASNVEEMESNNERTRKDSIPHNHNQSYGDTASELTVPSIAIQESECEGLNGDKSMTVANHNSQTTLEDAVDKTADAKDAQITSECGGSPKVVTASQQKTKTRR